jgi:hypothetical protein
MSNRSSEFAKISISRFSGTHLQSDRYGSFPFVSTAIRGTYGARAARSSGFLRGEPHAFRHRISQIFVKNLRDN